MALLVLYLAHFVPHSPFNWVTIGRCFLSQVRTASRVIPRQYVGRIYERSQNQTLFTPGRVGSSNRELKSAFIARRQAASATRGVQARSSTLKTRLSEITAPHWWHKPPPRTGRADLPTTKQADYTGAGWLRLPSDGKHLSFARGTLLLCCVSKLPRLIRSDQQRQRSLMEPVADSNASGLELGDTVAGPSVVLWEPSTCSSKPQPKSLLKPAFGLTVPLRVVAINTNTRHLRQPQLPTQSLKAS